MKKSDLPWIIPLLTAWSQGKTLQVKCAVSGKWFDYNELVQIKFTGAEGDYRIKPELKAPGKVACLAYHDAMGYSITSPYIPNKSWEGSALAVIRAYKNGELDLTGVNL